MKQLEEVIKKHLKSISEGEDMKHENYMFFGNIEQMKRQCELLMEENHDQIDNILKEHDWAQDHISEAKSLLDQVFDFLMNKTQGQYDNTFLNEEYQIDESKNCPTDPAKWAASKAKAKGKFKVYPSAYANGFAAKDYKSKGGRWKKCKK
jgi:dsDNA-specific endonuclease/ATPase MutS2